jgi:hypothetical protein
MSFAAGRTDSAPREFALTSFCPVPLARVPRRRVWPCQCHGTWWADGERVRQPHRVLVLDAECGGLRRCSLHRGLVILHSPQHRQLVCGRCRHLLRGFVLQPALALLGARPQRLQAVPRAIGCLRRLGVPCLYNRAATWRVRLSPGPGSQK